MYSTHSCVVLYPRFTSFPLPGDSQRSTASPLSKSSHSSTDIEPNADTFIVSMSALRMPYVPHTFCARSPAHASDRASGSLTSPSAHCTSTASSVIFRWKEFVHGFWARVDWPAI